MKHEPETRNSDAMHVVILGAGPAGLASAHELAANGVKVTVLERNGYVGGLCRTVHDGGYKFDLGGHRWFTKNEDLNNWFRRLMEGQLVHGRADQPHLLRRQVLHVSGGHRRRDQERRHLHDRQGRFCLHVGGGALRGVQPADQEHEGRVHGTVRLDAVRDVLPALHREGVGQAVRGAVGGLGVPAQQGPVDLDGRARGAVQPQDRGQEPDRGVHVSARRLHAHSRAHGRRHRTRRQPGAARRGGQGHRGARSERHRSRLCDRRGRAHASARTDVVSTIPLGLLAQDDHAQGRRCACSRRPAASSSAT